MSVIDLPSDLATEVTSFLHDLNANSEKKPSIAITSDILKVIKKVIGQSDWSTAEDVLCLLRHHFGHRASLEATGAEDVVANITRRVMKIIREEYQGALKTSLEPDTPSESSLHRIVRAADDDDQTKLTRNVPDLKAKVIDAVEELQMELETASDEISNQALEHIHANEVILTLGRSRTVELFLKHAAKERTFQVIVAECGPSYQGQAMATSLAKAKIQTTVITDSAIFAIMSRVNKVIIGTNAILANGGLKAIDGSYTVALSAKHFSVPLYVCSSLFKLTPQYYTSGDLGSFNKFVSPLESMRGMDGHILSKVQSVTPVFDYVPPELVTLFISNNAGFAPSYVYRLLSELYHPNDYDLCN